MYVGYTPSRLYKDNLLHRSRAMRNFEELRQYEVRRIPLPRTLVNKGKAEGRSQDGWPEFIAYSSSPALIAVVDAKLAGVKYGRAKTTQRTIVVRQAVGMDSVRPRAA